MAPSLALIIRRAELGDVAAITEIYNEAILNTTATFDTELKNVAEREQWFRGHGERHPILVAALDVRVVGWASVTEWSDRCAYSDTGEASLYVHSEFRGQGIGGNLLGALIEEARRLSFHTILGRITAENATSLRLSERAGFVSIGTMKEVGRKFGRLLDVHLLQLLLD